MDSSRGAQQAAVVMPLRQTRRARAPLPGWKPILVRVETYARLQKIRETTVDPRIDLHYLSDAALQVALDQGEDAIVKRAGADLKRRLPG